MAREFVVVRVGKSRQDEWESLCGQYRKRIEAYAPLREIVVRPAGGSSDLERIRREGRAILEALPDPCWTIALDRRGKALSSRDLATKLERLNEEWPHAVAFVIGSDLGLSEEISKSCRERLSFGPITLAHELARLVLYEQLFRALSIVRGIKYHREPL